MTYRELTEEEMWAELDEQARQWLGISAKQFTANYHAGVYDDPDDDPFVMRLAMQLEFLQRNGSSGTC